MNEKQTIRDVDLKNKRVLVRVDFNVPLDNNLNVTDDTRIKAALPTIKYILDKGGILILMSHLGRPDGKVVDKMRLNPAAERLSQLLGKKVTKLNDCIGQDVASAVSAAKPGDVILLENLRFHAQEEKNDPSFAKELAALGDVYVNDAFGTAHRAHASTEGVTKYLPGCAGFLIEKELKYLGKALANPAKPFIAILGGAKVSDKIAVVDILLEKVDAILIGGAMAYTFEKALGRSVGGSKLEKDKIDLASQILQKAKTKNVEIVLPLDHIIADKVDVGQTVKATTDDNIPDGWIGLDIGPKTVILFEEKLKRALTVLWNGPLGLTEIKPFDNGSREIAEFIARLTKGSLFRKGVISVIGGGDTAGAIAQFGLEDKMTHISTGGGASLEFLEGRTLPGIAALKDKQSHSVKSCCCCSK